MCLNIHVYTHIANFDHETRSCCTADLSQAFLIPRDQNIIVSPLRGGKISQIIRLFGRISSLL